MVRFSCSALDSVDCTDTACAWYRTLIRHADNDEADKLRHGWNLLEHEEANRRRGSRRIESKRAKLARGNGADDVRRKAAVVRRDPRSHPKAAGHDQRIAHFAVVRRRRSNT
jgi:hypothetical protein